MLGLIYGIWESFWRRMFGCDGWDKPYIKIRAVQHVMNVLVTMLFLWIADYSLWQNILCVAVFEGLFWSRAHGAVYDIGHGSVDEKRYEEIWYWKYCKKFIPKKYWYTETCDFLLLAIRYTLPSILCGIILFSFSPMFMGLIVATVYSLCWSAHDWELTDRPTEIAEWIVGFTSGLLLLM